MKRFNNLKISQKFLIIGLIIIPFVLALGGTGVFGVMQVNDLLQETQSVQLPSVHQLANVTQYLQNARIYNRQALLEADASKVEEAISNARFNLLETRKYWELYLKLPSVAAERVLWVDFEANWKSWNTDTENLFQQTALNTPDAKAKAEAILSKTSPKSQKLVDIVAQLSKINYDGALKLASSAQDTFDNVLKLVIVMMLLVVLVTVVAGLTLSRAISRPLIRLRDATQAVAQGDLTQKLNINSKDEVGQLAAAFNKMTANLGELNQEINRAGQELNGSAAELLALVNQQTAGASEQSAAIHQTSSTVNQVKATIDQTNQRARSMSDTALRSVSVAEEGQQSVSETVSGMSLIKEQVEMIAENILALSEQTQQIGEIITSVNDIAEQSNLLALNAAVEAARAGEHGRGFAVVANEVRNLAERSKQATSQVRTILNDIQKATNAVVMVTEEGTKGVDHGVRLVDRAGQTIRQLSEVIGENLSSTQQIIAVVQQQNVGVEQVAQSMSNINEVTNQNVAATRQLQQSVEGMSQLAGRFGELTGRYKFADTSGLNANRWN